MPPFLLLRCPVWSLLMYNRQRVGKLHCPLGPLGPEVATPIFAAPRRAVDAPPSLGHGGRCQSGGPPSLAPPPPPPRTWSPGAERPEVSVGVSYWPRPPGGSTCPGLGPRTLSCLLPLPAGSFPECASTGSRGPESHGLGRPGNVSVLVLARAALEGYKVTLGHPKSLLVGNKYVTSMLALEQRRSKLWGMYHRGWG